MAADWSCDVLLRNYYRIGYHFVKVTERETNILRRILPIKAINEKILLNVSGIHSRYKHYERPNDGVNLPPA